MNKFKKSKDTKLAALNFNESYFQFGLKAALEELNFNDLDDDIFIYHLDFEILHNSYFKMILAKAGR